MINIIGKGFIGSVLAEQTNAVLLGRNDNTCPNSSMCYVCAPTGNRIKVKEDPKKDKQDVLDISRQLHRMQPRTTVLISTVDVLLNDSNAYTENRKLLENSYDFDLIVRLPCLIHPSISKNLLWDLTNQKWLHSHNIYSIMQWYDLNYINRDIQRLLYNKTQLFNLVSQPIQNREIVKKFFPELESKLLHSSEKIAKYNVSNFSGYHITKQEIMTSINQYLKRKQNGY